MRKSRLARTPPPNSESTKNISIRHDGGPPRARDADVMPAETAGFSSPPEIAPAANPPAVTANPMARPKFWFVFLHVEVDNTV
mmetsp:Transcript_67741/g.123487  ORF Transcript_67741/g.123487 Transcript_67741/m.123487 type:complete len:83 (+) Transcript_67741:328-576(+)